MECLSAAAILIAIVVLVLTQRQKGDRALADQRQEQQIEGLRLLVARLEKRIVELERAAGIAPAPGAEAPRAAPPPPPEPAVPVPPPPARPSSPGPFSQPPAPPPGEGETVQAMPSPAPPPPAFQPPTPPVARPAAGLEERLGARLPVWIGSIALALAGAFLVKYSFEQGWLSPA
ncbi:MAG: DUF2339 domain-containing protein, partial [Thermoanaerobaculia bacterium]